MNIKYIEDKIKEVIIDIETLVEENQLKVLNAFKEYKVSDIHLNSSTGYGYDDQSRTIFDKVFAKAMDAEYAVVRPNILSGTHAIASCFFGILRPEDELLYITGEPYDTLKKVIGPNDEDLGSLYDFGIKCKIINRTLDGKCDYNTIRKHITAKTKMIAIQRSSGYSMHQSFDISQIEEIISFIKKIDNDIICFVDNCYGEFVEKVEPTSVGADLIAGSLIKNPGGGLAKSGGYIAGKSQLVRLASARLIAPGIESGLGATHGHMRDFFQGLFLAPHVVGEALKGAVFTAALLNDLGYETYPNWHSSRTDIIQKIVFGNKNDLLTFFESIQEFSPVDSYVKPIPSDLPGYSDPVVMAAGTFVQGASIELSADAPLREPFIAYMQGGLTYSHVKIAIKAFATKYISR